MFKKIGTLLTAIIIASMSMVPATTAAAAKPLAVSVNGAEMSFQYGNPIVVKDRSLVPLRDLLISLGIPDDAEHIQWDAATYTVTATWKDIQIKLTLGDTIIYKNNEVFRELDVPATLVNDRMYLPVRAVVEAFGHNVDYDPATNNVIIETKAEASSESGQNMTEPEEDTQKGTSESTGTSNTPAQTMDEEQPAVAATITVTSINPTSLSVQYSIKPDPAAAFNTANYSIARQYPPYSPLAITGASVQSDGKTVILTTESQVHAVLYQLTISNMLDQDNNTMSLSPASFVPAAPIVDEAEEPPVEEPEEEDEPEEVTPPSLISSATALSNTQVQLNFYDTIDPSAAASTSNYAFTNGSSLSIHSAQLQGDGKTVVLTTSSMVAGNLYFITAFGSQPYAFAGMAPPPPPEPETTNAIVSAISSSNTTVTLVFERDVDVSSALSAGNYSITNGLSVESAVMGGDGKTVILTTNAQTHGKLYSVTANLKDTNGSSFTSSKVFAG